MDGAERATLDSLLIRDIDHELDQVLAQQVYSRARGILDRAPDTTRQGINCSSDDDPILTVRQVYLDYVSDKGSCTLVLSNFHAKRCSDTASSHHVRLEVCEGGLDSKQLRYAPKEMLFSLDDNGKIESPLGLVEATIADSLVTLFEENERAARLP
jgi:hypothetical protein